MLEGVPDDALHALARADVLLNGKFVGGPLLEEAAHAHVQTLGVLAEDDEVDVTRRPPLQRRETVGEETDGALVDVQIEPEPQTEQDVGRVPVVRDPGVAQGPQQDGVIAAQRVEGRVGKGLAGLEEVVGPVREGVEIQLHPADLRCDAQAFDSLAGHLDPDTVARDDRDAAHAVRSPGGPPPGPNLRRTQATHDRRAGLSSSRSPARDRHSMSRRNSAALANATSTSRASAPADSDAPPGSSRTGTRLP